MFRNEITFSGRLAAQAATVALAQDDRLWPVNYGMEQVVNNRAPTGGYVRFVCHSYFFHNLHLNTLKKQYQWVRYSVGTTVKSLVLDTPLPLH